MSSDLLCQVRPTFGRVAVGDLPKIGNPQNPDEYSYPQIAKVAVRKGTMNWVMTIENKGGLVSKVGYTNKTAEQIKDIEQKWIAEGMRVLRTSRREG